MSKRSPWIPPYPDPYRRGGEGTPYSYRREAEAQRSTGPRCVWLNCLGHRSTIYDTDLCSVHADRTFDIVRQHHEAIAREAAEDARLNKEADALAEEQVNRGERLGQGAPIPGWIYYIQIDDTIKIGYAKNVTTRMRAYPPSAKLLAVEHGTKVLERKRHDHFNAYLAHGREWFRDVPELREWITTLVEEYGNPSRMAYTYRTPQSGKQVTVPRGYRGHKKTAA